MIWAKAEKKHFFPRPRMAMMTIYTVSLCLLSLAAFAQTATGYRVTMAEAEQQIAEELMHNGLGSDVQASIIGRRATDLVQRSEPIIMEVADLQADENTGRFSAILAFSTESTLDKPGRKLGNLSVVGRYDEMVEVPVVKYRLGSSDVIREDDLEWQKMPQNRLKRETVLEMAQLIGKTPVRGLSPGRAIETAELQTPAIVTRNAPVRMRYQSENISIQAVGTAMQDGSMGQKIKVRNDDSGTEVDALVVDRGHVEVLPAIAFN